VNKKGFGLITVLIVVVLFSYFSISIVQNKNLNSKIDQLKFLDLQSQIYLKNIKTYILNHNATQIANYKPTDKLFRFQIIKDDTQNTTIYHIYIKGKNGIPISIYDKVTIQH